jgi:hypothetical protein
VIFEMSLRGVNMSFEYRVISLSDRGFFSGSLSTITVQGKINEMADDGWELKDVTSCL